MVRGRRALKENCDDTSYASYAPLSSRESFSQHGSKNISVVHLVAKGYTFLETGLTMNTVAVLCKGPSDDLTKVSNMPISSSYGMVAAN